MLLPACRKMQLGGGLVGAVAKSITVESVKYGWLLEQWRILCVLGVRSF